MMKNKDKIKQELKIWLYYEAVKLANDNNEPLTFEDINSVLIGMLYENSRHDPKQLFKQQ